MFLGYADTSKMTNAAIAVRDKWLKDNSGKGFGCCDLSMYSERFLRLSNLVMVPFNHSGRDKVDLMKSGLMSYVTPNQNKIIKIGTPHEHQDKFYKLVYQKENFGKKLTENEVKLWKRIDRKIEIGLRYVVDGRLYLFCAGYCVVCRREHDRMISYIKVSSGIEVNFMVKIRCMEARDTMRVWWNRDSPTDMIRVNTDFPMRLFKELFLFYNFDSPAEVVSLKEKEKSNDDDQKMMDQVLEIARERGIHIDQDADPYVVQKQLMNVARTFGIHIVPNSK